MFGEHLRQLLPDRQGRVQRLGGILEDHRDSVPTNVSQLLFGDTQEVYRLTRIARTERHLSARVDAGRRRNESEKRLGRHALARTRLPHETEGLALVYVQCYPVYRVHHPAPRREVDTPVSYTHLRAHETKANLVC